MRPDPGQPVYTLRVASGLVGLSERTIRSYEEADLLAPARTGGNQQRLYSGQDLQWLRCIRDMIHEEGLTVVAIRRLLDLVPCWEVRHCEPDVAAQCRPNLRIPQMAGEAPVPPLADSAGEPEAPTAAVEIRLFYGVQELGAVLPCSRCITAERAARRVALGHPGQVVVRKYDLLSDEASSVGVVMPPTILVDDELVASGTGVSERRLDAVVQRHIELLTQDQGPTDG